MGTSPQLLDFADLQQAIQHLSLGAGLGWRREPDIQSIARATAAFALFGSAVNGAKH
jgi:hypothetical protein